MNIDKLATLFASPRLRLLKHESKFCAHRRSSALEPSHLVPNKSSSFNFEQLFIPPDRSNGPLVIQIGPPGRLMGLTHHYSVVIAVHLDH
jgi:hypothetical protein